MLLRDGVWSAHLVGSDGAAETPEICETPIRETAASVLAWRAAGGGGAWLPTLALARAQTLSLAVTLALNPRLNPSPNRGPNPELSPSPSPDQARGCSGRPPSFRGCGAHTPALP